jgi:hypothetical protein
MSSKTQEETSFICVEDKSLSGNHGIAYNHEEVSSHSPY